MSEVRVFVYEEVGDIRVLEENGNILFCGSDAARALGYSNPRDALNRHCKGVVKRDIPTNGGMQELLFINEPNLYRLAFGSKLPSAERFTDWVTETVLPSIRKNGAYIMGQEDPNLTDEEIFARALVSANRVLEAREERIRSLEKEKAVMQPKAEYYDELVDRNGLTGLRVTAKELGVGQTQLIDFLIDNGFLYRDSKRRLLPYAAKNNGYFEVKDKINLQNSWAGFQTMVTPKGRDKIRVLLRKANIPMRELQQ